MKKYKLTSKAKDFYAGAMGLAIVFVTFYLIVAVNF